MSTFGFAFLGPETGKRLLQPFSAVRPLNLRGWILLAFGLLPHSRYKGGEPGEGIIKEFSLWMPAFAGMRRERSVYQGGEK
jgi:hypothetical protein